MLYQIKVEGSDGVFTAWEIIDLPNSAAAYERCQSLSALHGKSFSAGPLPPPAAMIPIVEVKGWVRRSPVVVAAILGALGSGPIWWAIFHYL